jgi:hypothetical protein
MFGAFRSTLILCDARNQFTKNANKRLSQCQKRNARRAAKIVMENARILREGRAALAAVNARLLTAARNASAERGSVAEGSAAAAAADASQSQTSGP